MCEKYKASLGGNKVGVPREIIAAATQLAEDRIAGVNLGLADAVPQSGSDEMIILE